MPIQALIIDDTPSNVLVLQQLLRVEGVATVKASIGKDISNELDTIKDIDVVFLDLEMPFIDGYSMIKMIREHPNFQTSKVIAYSVHVSEVDISLDDLRFDGFLGKPINAEAFPEQWRQIVNGEQVRFIP